MNSVNSPKLKLFIVSISACTFISLYVAIVCNRQNIGITLERYIGTIQAAASFHGTIWAEALFNGSSIEGHTLDGEDLEIEVLHELKFEKRNKSKIIDKPSSMSPVPIRSDTEQFIIFTHEQLCDKNLTWDQLPDDDSWSKHWSWPRPSTLSRTPQEKEIMLIIYRHQLCRGDRNLPEPCNRTLEFDSYRTGSGVGSRMITLSKALANSLYSNRALRISHGDWRYSTKEKCPEMSDICFYKEISRCPNVSWPYAKDFEIFEQPHKEPGDPTPHVRMWFPAGKPPIPKLSSLPTDENPGQFWYGSHLLYFLIQPKDWVLKRVNVERLKLQMKQPYLAIHVRHGDKWKEGAEFFDLEIYMNVVRKHFPLIKNLLIITSDQKVIDDTKGWPDYNFYYTEYPRHNGDIKELMNEGVLNRFDEMVNALINFYLAVDSAGMVCTLTSNFPRAIMRFQFGAYNQLNPVYSLDKWYKDVAIHNFPTDELGKVVHFINQKDYLS